MFQDVITSSWQVNGYICFRGRQWWRGYFCYKDCNRLSCDSNPWPSDWHGGIWTCKAPDLWVANPVTVTYGNFVVKMVFSVSKFLMILLYTSEWRHVVYYAPPHTHIYAHTQRSHWIVGWFVCLSQIVCEGNYVELQFRRIAVNQHSMYMILLQTFTCCSVFSQWL